MKKRERKKKEEATKTGSLGRRKPYKGGHLIQKRGSWVSQRVDKNKIGSWGNEYSQQAHLKKGVYYAAE